MSVSVIVPMRNAENYIIACLKSVLASSYSDIEIVVVDDKSTDCSRNLVESIGDQRIKVFDGPGKGISECLNVGFQAANGDVLMRCDADDLYPSNRIEQQVNWLTANPEFGALCGSYSTIDATGRSVAAMPCGDFSCEVTAELRAGITRTHLCTFAIRSHVAKGIKFRPFFTTGEDIDFQLKLGENCRVFYQETDRYTYRIHGSSIIHNHSFNQNDFFEALARSTQVERLNGEEDSIDRGKILPVMPTQVGSVFSSSQHLHDLLIGNAWLHQEKGLKLKALALHIRALIHQPFKIKSWKSFIALAVR